MPAPVLAAFEQEMKQEHADYQINIYGGAVHAFTNPAADTYHVPGVAYNAEADRRSWAAAQDFLAEVFKPAVSGRPISPIPAGVAGGATDRAAGRPPAASGARP